MIRKLFPMALWAACTIATAATLTPIQLLNPAGSASGQAILSTGPNTAPVWGGVVLENVTGTLPISKGGTGATNAATALSNLGGAALSGATFTGDVTFSGFTSFSTRPVFGSATPWDSANLASPASTTGNLSQFSSTTSSQLAGVISNETGTGALVFGTSPTLTTPTISGASLSGTFSGAPTFSGAVSFSSTITPSPTAGIVGTTTNNNANAGSVGEYLSSTASATALTTGVASNCASQSLTPGDWDVDGSVLFGPAVSTAISSLQAAIGITSATFPATVNTTLVNASFTTGAGDVISAPTTRVSISATTTVYLVGRASFSGGTMTCDGFIRARRVR